MTIEPGINTAELVSMAGPDDEHRAAALGLGDAAPTA